MGARKGNAAALRADALSAGDGGGLLDDEFAGAEPDEYFFGAFAGSAGDPAPDDVVAVPAPPGARGPEAESGNLAAAKLDARAADGEADGDAKIALEADSQAHVEPKGALALPAASAGLGSATAPDGAPVGRPSAGHAPEDHSVAADTTVKTPAELVAAVTHAARGLPGGEPGTAPARGRAGARAVVEGGRAFSAALEGRIRAEGRAGGRGGGGGRAKPPITDPVEVDPVPTSTKAIGDARDAPLPPLELPRPLAPPSRPPVQVAPPRTVAPQELAREKPPPPEPKANAKSRAARVADDVKGVVAKATALDAAPGQEQAPAKAVEPPVLLDLRVPPTPKVSEAQSAEERKQVQDVVARLKADLSTPAKKVVVQARLAAYGELLNQELADLPALWAPAVGDDVLAPGIAAGFAGKLDDLAAAAGIAASVLSDAVLERQRAMVQGGQQVSEELRRAVGAAADKLTGEAERLTGAAEAEKKKRDKKHLRELEAGLHSHDPRLVDQLVDERLLIITDIVARGTLTLEAAAKRRTDNIAAYEAAYSEAYRIADDDAQRAESPPKAPLAPSGEPWLRVAEDTVRRQMSDLRKATASELARRIDALKGTGLDAKAALRDWADKRLRRDAKKRDRDAERAADERAAKDAESATRLKVEKEKARDDLVGQIRYAKAFHDLIQAEADGTITEDRKKVLASGKDAAKAYLAAGGEPSDPLAAVAAHLRDAASAEALDRLVKEDVIGAAVAQVRPAWGDEAALMSLGRVIFANKPPDADVRVAKLSGATREKIGTDEDEVYKQLDNLNGQQLLVVKALYQARFHEDLEERIDGETSGAENDRAMALLRGDQAMSVAAAIRYEQNSIFLSPDKEKVLEAINSLPPGQADEMRAKFKGEYDKDLDEALSATMRDFRMVDEDHVEVDDRGVDQAKLLLQVNMLRADKKADPAQLRRLQAETDAIEIDRALRPANGDAKADAMDKVFKRIRDDVANAHPEWTQEQVDSEVRRRNATVEDAYGDRLGGALQSKDPSTSALRQVMASQLVGSGEPEIGKAMLDVDRNAEIAARLLLADRGSYAADDDVNAALQANVDRAADEVRRKQGPELRKELAAKVEDRRKAGHPLTQDELDAEERAVDRKLEKLINERAAVLMDQVRATWKPEKAGSMSLDTWVRDRTQWSGHDEAKFRLQQGGGLSRAQQVMFGVRGWDMDKDQVTKGLEGRTPDEIKEIATEFKQLTGEDLTERLHRESSGRNRFDLDEALRGIPMTAQERMDALTRRHEYERTTYFMGSEADRDLAVGGNLDLLDRQYTQAQDRFERLRKAPESMSVEDRNALQRSFTVQAGRAVTAADEYRAAVDRYTEEMVQVLTAIATVVVIIATWGAAAPLVALAGSLAATATTIATKAILLGGAYGLHEFAADAIVGAVDAVVAVGTAGLGDKLLGVAKATGGTRLAVEAAVKQAAIQKAAKPMVAKMGAWVVEQFAQAAPSAIVGSALDRNNWRGDPFKNIVKASAAQVGTGMFIGGVTHGVMTGVHAGLDVLGKYRASAPRDAVTLSATEGALKERPGPRDTLANRGTPEERLAAFHDWHEQNPTRTMDDFRRAVDEGTARLEADAERVRRLQREMRTELLAELPPHERGAFKDAPITVLPSAEFTARTGSEAKGMAAVLVIEGRPQVVVREGAPLHALREEGIHLRQLADPVHADKLRLLDESRLAPENWKKLPIEERMKSSEAHLELEIDAQRQRVDNLERRLRAEGPDPALEAQLDQVRSAHETLTGRREELAAFRTSGGAGTPPPFLEEPSRLFTKVADPKPEGKPRRSRMRSDPEVEARALEASRARQERVQAEVAERRGELEGVEAERSRLGDFDRRYRDARGEAAEASTRASTATDPSERRTWRTREDDALRRARRAIDDFGEAYPDVVEGAPDGLAERYGLLRAELNARALQAGEIRTHLDELHGKVDFESYRYADLGQREPCFPAGTSVWTPAGRRAIETLSRSTPVISYDTTSGEPVISLVVGVTTNWTRRMTRVVTDEGTLEATPSHPFWLSTDKAWCRAEELPPGGLLRRADGTTSKVVAVESVPMIATTYNIEVAETHTYFVGASGLLVHNGGDSGFTSGTRTLTRIYVIKESKTEKVVYVGKTFQGEAGDVHTRFEAGHLRTKKGWSATTHHPEPVKEGMWTTYETACWEQHFIEKHGGVAREHPGSPLINEVNAITAGSFNENKQGYGHNPCGH